MNCPVCSVELKMADRQGVEIDYCPKCRGVWLDRGELDKIIERSAAIVQTAAPNENLERREEYRPDPYRHGDHDDDRHHDDKAYGDKHRKRRGLLGDIFDFG